MRIKDDPHIRELLENEVIATYNERRDDLRQQAKENIAKIQVENKKQFNKRRKEGKTYQEGDFVAIKRTQFGTGLKFHSKFLGPYRITKVLRHDRYVVQKIGEGEGPQRTSTSADYMKPWPTSINGDISE
ncbi:hypothetical protein WN55_04256 [Dufourea novaeangliae]|uniref:Uncharacterized protein n=1 Tax=Dufourea novaeangliae TaxID=178035 RepID=A0A154P000_DUFNO|nr:hypothetical protein WN55_04256 [Dufourea novaeangliae]